ADVPPSDRTAGHAGRCGDREQSSGAFRQAACCRTHRRTRYGRVRARPDPAHSPGHGRHHEWEAAMMRLLNICVIAALIAAAGYVYKIKFESTRQAERVAKLRTELRREHDA